jgi:hypothetical protein
MSSKTLDGGGKVGAASLLGLRDYEDYDEDYEEDDDGEDNFYGNAGGFEERLVRSEERLVRFEV